MEVCRKITSRASDPEKGFWWVPQKLIEGQEKEMIRRTRVTTRWASGSPDHLREVTRENQGWLPPSPLRKRRNNEDPCSWETSTIKSGRSYNVGSFGAIFRTAYNATSLMRRLTVNFFLDKGYYHLRKGNKIWKSMESMKARWDKFLIKNLAKYKVSEEELAARCRGLVDGR